MVSGPGYRYIIPHIYLLFYYLCNLIHLHGADGRWVWTLFLCLWRHVFRVHFWEGRCKSTGTHPIATHTLLTPAARGCCHCYDANHLFWWVFMLISTKNRHTEGKVKQVQAGFVVPHHGINAVGGKTNKLDWRLKWYFWQVINAWVSLELCCCKQLQTFSYYEVVMEYYNRAPDAELFWAKFEVVFIVYMQKEYSDMHLYLHSSHK